MFAASGLNGPPCGTPDLSANLDDLLHKVHDLWVLDPLGDLVQKHRMPDRVEIARQIHIDDGGHAPHHTAPDFRQGAMWRPFRSKSVGVGTEVRLEHSF